MNDAQPRPQLICAPHIIFALLTSVSCRKVEERLHSAALPRPGLIFALHTSAICRKVEERLQSAVLTAAHISSDPANLDDWLGVPCLFRAPFSCNHCFGSFPRTAPSMMLHTLLKLRQGMHHTSQMKAAMVKLQRPSMGRPVRASRADMKRHCRLNRRFTGGQVKRPSAPSIGTRISSWSIHVPHMGPAEPSGM